MESDTFDPIAPADQSGPENSGPVTPVAPDATGAIPDLAVTAGAVTPDLVKLALRKVKDPELNLNIVDLGLVYDIRVEGNDVGELIPIKRLLGLPVVAVAPKASGRDA